MFERAAGAATYFRRVDGLDVKLMMDEAIALQNRGDTRGALAKYEECRACARTKRDAAFDRKVEGSVETYLALMYSSLGQVDKAMAHFEQALIIIREIGDRLSEILLLRGLGKTNSSLGEHAKAIKYCKQALAIAREIGDRWLEGQCLANLETYA